MCMERMVGLVHRGWSRELPARWFCPGGSGTWMDALISAPSLIHSRVNAKQANGLLAMRVCRNEWFNKEDLLMMPEIDGTLRNPPSRRSRAHRTRIPHARQKSPAQFSFKWAKDALKNSVIPSQGQKQGQFPRVWGMGGDGGIRRVKGGGASPAKGSRELRALCGGCLGSCSGVVTCSNSCLCPVLWTALKPEEKSIAWLAPQISASLLDCRFGVG